MSDDHLSHKYSHTQIARLRPLHWIHTYIDVHRHRHRKRRESCLLTSKCMQQPFHLHAHDTLNIRTPLLEPTMHCPLGYNTWIQRDPGVTGQLRLFVCGTLLQNIRVYKPMYLIKTELCCVCLRDIQVICWLWWEAQMNTVYTTIMILFSR